jgi:hypothetical protein
MLIFNEARGRLTKHIDILDKYYSAGFWPMVDGIEKSIKEEELDE